MMEKTHEEELQDAMDEMFSSRPADETLDWSDLPEEPTDTEIDFEKIDSINGGLVEKSDKPKVEVDANFQSLLKKRTPAIALVIRKWLKKDAKRIADFLISKLFPAEKLDDLSKGLTEAEVDAILDVLDLESMRLLAGAITEQTADVFKNAYAKGVAIGGAMVDMTLVGEATIQYAHSRAAELVGMKFIDGKWMDNPSAEWSISDTTRKLLRAEVVKGIASGSSAKELAKAIQNNYGFSDTRALNIARTELSNAFNVGSLNGWAESGENVYKRSLLSDSYEIEDECGVAARDGAIPLDKPFSNGMMSPAYHPNCLIAGTVVSAVGIEAHYTRRFKGEVVTITTASGKQLTATPNHPVLTDAGWVSVGELKLGDCIFESANPERLVVSENPDDYNVPTVIEQIPHSLVMSGSVTARQVPTSSVDFHGDGVADGNVDIVFSTRFLENNIAANNLGNMSLKVASIDGSNLLGLGSGDEVIIGSNHSANGIVSSLGDAGSLVLGESGHSDECSIASTSNGKSQIGESPVEGYSWDATLKRDFVDGLAIGVSESEIVKIDIGEFDGHVYNLQTVSGWYVANGIATHNCKCSLSPVVVKKGKVK